MKAILNTNLGTIEIELYSEKAPSTVENFIKYVNEGYYNGTIFHRVINEFMIQGGGFGEDMFQKASTTPAINNEANNGLKNEKYTVAMARTMDPHSATSQFFINVKDNHFLNFVSEELNNWGYAVFGKVISGMDVVDKIKVVKTGRKNSHDDVPLTPVVILTATIDN